jgi:hypothetical protein
MRVHPKPLAIALALVALGGAVNGAEAQGKGNKGSKTVVVVQGEQGGKHEKPKHEKGKYVVSRDRAVVVTREVLVRQGYEVVRVERSGLTQVVWYRRGNMGRGRGKGPMEKLVIRQVNDRVYFEETSPAVLLDIDVRIRL